MTYKVYSSYMGVFYPTLARIEVEETEHAAKVRIGRFSDQIW